MKKVSLKIPHDVGHDNTFVIPLLFGRLKQEDGEFEVSLCFIVRLSQNKYQVINIFFHSKVLSLIEFLMSFPH